MANNPKMLFNKHQQKLIKDLLHLQLTKNEHNPLQKKKIYQKRSDNQNTLSHTQLLN